MEFRFRVHLSAIARIRKISFPFSERPSLREWAGIAMVAAGVLVLALKRWSPLEKTARVLAVKSTRTPIPPLGITCLFPAGKQRYSATPQPPALQECRALHDREGRRAR